MASQLKNQLRIIIYRGFQGSGAYVWSPFVTKLEARLRFAGVSYRTEAGSLSKAPRGKIPYIEISKTDSGSPTTLADTVLITEKLVEDGVLDDLNAKLSPAEKAHDLAIRGSAGGQALFLPSTIKHSLHGYRQLDLSACKDKA